MNALYVFVLVALVIYVSRREFPSLDVGVFVFQLSLVTVPLAFMVMPQSPVLKTSLAFWLTLIWPAVLVITWNRTDGWLPANVYNGLAYYITIVLAGLNLLNAIAFYTLVVCSASFLLISWIQMLPIGEPEVELRTARADSGSGK